MGLVFLCVQSDSSLLLMFVGSTVLFVSIRFNPCISHCFVVQMVVSTYTVEMQNHSAFVLQMEHYILCFSDDSA